MNEIITQIVGKISSYNIFTNLYPGIVFCYLLKFMTGVKFTTDNFFENLVIFYFVGMLISRISSIIIEPILLQIKIKEKGPLLRKASYEDYEEASDNKSILPVLSEVNNTYRTLLSTFVCMFFCKIYFVVKETLIANNFQILEKVDDWIILIFLIILFLCSYVKQTTYIRKNVESYMKRKKNQHNTIF